MELTFRPGECRGGQHTLSVMTHRCSDGVSVEMKVGWRRQGDTVFPVFVCVEVDVLDKLVREGLSGRVTFVWRVEWSEQASFCLWQEPSRQRNSKCKGPEVVEPGVLQRKNTAQLSLGANLSAPSLLPGEVATQPLPTHPSSSWTSCRVSHLKSRQSHLRRG